ncbi:MAG TPA: JAB domain-containing protein [Anaeromyxobacteraceae bacterium]|nr:JAB domain-containing protein [Anaeromyxobacteraceae bacterium]
MDRREVRERMMTSGPTVLSNEELLVLVGAASLAGEAMARLAWMSAGELVKMGLAEGKAAAVVAAFELGRRGAWAPPQRGERCLDPRTVHELMRGLAHAPVEEFHVVLLDVRGRLIRTEKVAQGSVSQCPVSPREVFRVAVREAAHGVVFVHNHPSGNPSPSPEDADLTERLRAGAAIVGVSARDHVIVAADGYFSFVEAGRWR